MSTRVDTTPLSSREHIVTSAALTRLTRVLDLWRTLRATTTSLFGAEIHLHHARRGLGTLNRATRRDIGVD